LALFGRGRVGNTIVITTVISLLIAAWIAYLVTTKMLARG